MTASVALLATGAALDGGFGVALRIVAVMAGLLVLWAAIMAAAGVMLVPRPSNQKLALAVSRTCHFVFKLLVRRVRSYEQLDRFLAVQGPSTVLVYLVLFLSVFLAAFALLFFGFTGGTPWQAFNRAGSGMSTLGVVDVAGAPGLTVMFVAAFTGTTVVSVFIGFLLTLYSAYTTRETFMSKVALLCGEPGWGPEMVVRMHKLKLPTGASSIESSVEWICSLRVSQYIQPMLNHFRSPVRNRHWVVTLLALLDAAAIRLTAIDRDKDPSLVRLIAEGADAFEALRLSEASGTATISDQGAMITWSIEEVILGEGKGTPASDPCLTREEWDHAMAFMESYGVPLAADREAAWESFCRVRSTYAQTACFLAMHLSAVRAPWSGPRHPSFDFPLVLPRLAREAAERERGDG